MITSNKYSFYVFLKKNAIWLSVLFTLFLGIALVNILRPIFVSYLFEPVFFQKNPHHVNEFFKVLFVMNGFIFLLSLIRLFLYTYIEKNVLFYLQMMVMDKLLNLPLVFFNQYTVGDLLHRVLWIHSLSPFLSNISLFLSFFASLISFCVMFYFNWQLTLLVFILIVFFTLIACKMALKLIPNLEKHAQNIGLAYGTLFQVIHGISRIKLFARQSDVETLWESMYIGARKKLYQTYRHGVVGYALFNSIPLLLLMFIFAWVSLKNCSEHFILFFCALCTLLGSIGAFYIQAGQIIETLIAYRRVQPILLTKPESEPSTTFKYDAESHHHICITNLVFSYPHTHRIILRDINCRIAYGEHVAFVGLSGSGKSTLVKLLLGFYSCQQDKIQINGHSLIHSNLFHVRKKMGVVLQDTQLMHGSILENIIGHTTATEEDAQRVLVFLGLDDMINHLPMGIHTIVSQPMLLLSEGQKQMVLLARALVTHPQLLILDEALHALDTETQYFINKKIDQLNMTRITITHRLSMLQHVDKIFVLDQGRIVQEGHYQQLIKQEGLFSQLLSH